MLNAVDVVSKDAKAEALAHDEAYSYRPASATPVSTLALGDGAAGPPRAWLICEGMCRLVGEDQGHVTEHVYDARHELAGYRAPNVILAVAVLYRCTACGNRRRYGYEEPGR